MPGEKSFGTESRGGVSLDIPLYRTLQANSCVLQLRGLCFPGSALNTIGFPPIKQPLALEAEAFAFGCPRKMGQKKEIFFMSYLNSVTIRRICWCRPRAASSAERHSSKFTVLSVATQRSWKNTDDEWASKTDWHRVCVIWNLR
jgi:hypothetical protein